jgi:hypothetical protein
MGILFSLAVHGAQRHFIIEQVLFLWERLPAAIISWQDATPTTIA